MPIKRNVRIDPSLLGISATPEIDRRQLLERSQYSAQAKIDRAKIAESENGAGALRIRQRLQERNCYLSMEDLMGIPNRQQPLDRRDAFQGMETSGMLTEEFPTHHDDRIIDEMYRPQQRTQNQARALPEQRARSQPVQQRQSLREQIMDRPVASATNWQVKAFMGETQSGQQVPVWKVMNARTGTTYGKLFKAEGVATRIAGYLNESGDSNDPRALGLVHTYEKREQLLKQARLLEQTAAGKPMKTEQLKAMYREIGQLDSRLGV